MKKILLTAFVFLTFCLSSFAESVFVPDITTEQAKKAVTNYIVSKGWFFKEETNYSLVFEKEERAHDPILYQQEELAIEKLYKLKSDRAEKMEESFQKKNLLNEVRELRYKKPEYYNSWKKVNLQFIFTENNGVTITTRTSSQEIKDMIKYVFSGYYSYNLEYKIPLLKKHVEISDTNQTYYNNQTRMGINRKVVKINDQNISAYSKASLKNLLGNCTQEQIKLETDDKLGRQIFYINRTYIEPTYKQYL